MSLCDGCRVLYPSADGQVGALTYAIPESARLRAMAPADRSRAPKAKTVAEVATDLQINRITVYRLLKTGELPGYRVGRLWRIDSEQLQDWLNEQRKPSRQG